MQLNLFNQTSKAQIEECRKCDKNCFHFDDRKLCEYYKSGDCDDIVYYLYKRGEV